MENEAYLTSGDYSIFKALQEDILRNGACQNWTILRPTITFSQERFQLTTLEAHTLIYRMLRGKTMVLPCPKMPLGLTKESTPAWMPI